LKLIIVPTIPNRVLDWYISYGFTWQFWWSSCEGYAKFGAH